MFGHCGKQDVHALGLHAVQVSRCDHCNGLVKPGVGFLEMLSCQACQLMLIHPCNHVHKACWHADIVFFGEPLPMKFFNCCAADLPRADLVIVMGTSLSVSPFSDLPELVCSSCPRLLINREIVGKFEFDAEQGTRDALFQGDCDCGAAALVNLLGWDAEFEELLSGMP